jgi:hypothetical protein
MHNNRFNHILLTPLVCLHGVSLKSSPMASLIFLRHRRHAEQPSAKARVSSEGCTFIDGAVCVVYTGRTHQTNRICFSDCHSWCRPDASLVVLFEARVSCTRMSVIRTRTLSWAFILACHQQTALYVGNDCDVT